MPDFEVPDYAVAEAMVRFGGSFVEALGRAYHKADARNQARIKAAFPELWAEYVDIVQRGRLAR